MCTRYVVYARTCPIRCTSITDHHHGCRGKSEATTRTSVRGWWSLSSAARKPDAATTGHHPPPHGWVGTRDTHTTHTAATFRAHHIHRNKLFRACCAACSRSMYVLLQVGSYSHQFCLRFTPRRVYARIFFCGGLQRFFEEDSDGDTSSYFVASDNVMR